MMPLYALVDRQRQRAVKDGPRRASCAECGEPMLAKTGAVLIWHWAHVKDNPHCEAARESEWHLAWKALGIDGTQEITVGRHRADVLAPGGFAVEFQASPLDREEVSARESGWAAQGGMVWVLQADRAFAAGRITMAKSLAGYEK
jgi:competence CoiA-like predicted nuclease